MLLGSLGVAEHARAHHLEVSRLELRPIRAGELRGRLLLAPAAFPSGPGEADGLLGRVSTGLELSVAGVACRAAPVLVELWTESSPSPGHLVDLKCPAPSGAEPVEVSVLWRENTDLLVTYPRTATRPELSVLVAPHGRTAFAAGPVGPSVGTEARNTRPTPAETMNAPAAPSFLALVRLGLRHVLPDGFDHVLFVLALMLSARERASLLLARLSLFTGAHGLALYAGALGVVSVPSRVLEPLIAASIVVLAARTATSAGRLPSLAPGPSAPRASERTVQRELTTGLVVSLFGLLHGLGFAGAFRSLGLAHERLISALFAFHIGVEFGQCAVLLLGLVAVGAIVRRARRRGGRHAEHLVRGAAALVAVLGAALLMERLWSP